MLDLMEFISNSYKKMLIKILNKSFVHFMSWKLIKTTQKCLIFWNLLGVLINKVLVKKRFTNFDKWGKWRLDPIFFLRIVKLKGIIPKCLFFFNKNNQKFAAVKKKKSLRYSDIKIFFAPYRRKTANSTLKVKQRMECLIVIFSKKDKKKNNFIKVVLLFKNEIKKN